MIDVAISAAFDSMRLAELRPMTTLPFVEHTGAATQGARTIKRGHYRGSDELRPVGDALHRFNERVFGFESDDVGFAVHMTSSVTNYYLIDSEKQQLTGLFLPVVG